MTNVNSLIQAVVAQSTNFFYGWFFAYAPIRIEHS
jgi:hypothetical protein